MPIIVKDYTWSQTNNTVHIKVPISKASHEKVDLFPTDKYIKAHYSPFLFEIFLLYEVNIDESKCIVNEDFIVLDLKKKEETEWETLEKELSKEEKAKIRQEVLEECQEKAKQNAEEKVIRKTKLDRYTVSQAIEIDNKLHNIMDSRRDMERKTAMDALEEWRVNSDKPKQKQIVNPPRNNENGVVITELPPSDEETPTVKNDIKEKKAPKPKSTPKKPIKTPVRSEYVEKKKEEIEKRVLPTLRQRGEVEITHTPRTFPTPSRESAYAEEQAWLKNITLARRATGFVSEDLRPEEQDPQWCKEKGDEFFRNGNYLGAISAYSHGITLSDRLPSLFANRSATHFALGNFNKCMIDCSAALDLLKPPCESNRKLRAKCIARRAAALARTGRLSSAIDEMKAAVKLLPEDESLKQDLYTMERAWEQNPDDSD